QGSDVLPKILIPECTLDEEEQQQDLQETLHTWVGEAQGGCALLADRHWLLHLLERRFTDEAIVADELDFEQTSVGCKADLAQFGKVFEAPANTKVTGIVDGRFGSQCLQQLVILLDTRLLVVDMQRWHDAVSDDASTELAWCAAIDLAVEY